MGHIVIYRIVDMTMTYFSAKESCVDAIVNAISDIFSETDPVVMPRRWQRRLEIFCEQLSSQLVFIDKLNSKKTKIYSQ